MDRQVGDFNLILFLFFYSPLRLILDYAKEKRSQSSVEISEKEISWQRVKGLVCFLHAGEFLMTVCVCGYGRRVAFLMMIAIVQLIFPGGFSSPHWSVSYPQEVPGMEIGLGVDRDDAVARSHRSVLCNRDLCQIIASYIRAPTHDP